MVLYVLASVKENTYTTNHFFGFTAIYLMYSSYAKFLNV